MIDVPVREELVVKFQVVYLGPSCESQNHKGAVKNKIEVLPVFPLSPLYLFLALVLLRCWYKAVS